MALPPRVAQALLAVVTAALWLPTLVVLGTFITVLVTGCDVNEAAAHPCIVAGHDIGDALYAGLIAVFLAGPTLPFAIGGVVALFWLRRRLATARPSPQ